MSITILGSLSSAVSEERLVPYRQGSEDSLVLPFARYFWNVALGESLYPTLQVLEITLRNSLHQVISLDRGTEDWFEKVLDPKDKPALEEIESRLSYHGIPPKAGQIVANSDFGFWIRLLNSRYENVLWPKLLRDAFLFMPNVDRTRRNISRRMNSIRAMRNRVFHYEPIWNRANLRQRHDEILETIGWINKDILEVVRLFDSFPEVYHLGVGHYETILSSYLAERRT